MQMLLPFKYDLRRNRCESESLPLLHHYGDALSQKKKIGRLPGYIIAAREGCILSYATCLQTHCVTYKKYIQTKPKTK